MMTKRLVVGLVAAVASMMAAAGCNGGGETRARLDELEARLERLETEVAQHEDRFTQSTARESTREARERMRGRIAEMMAGRGGSTGDLEAFRDAVRAYREMRQRREPAQEDDDE